MNQKRNNWEEEFDKELGNMGSFKTGQIDMINRMAAKHIDYKDFIKKLLASQKEEIIEEIERFLTSHYDITPNLNAELIFNYLSQLKKK